MNRLKIEYGLKLEVAITRRPCLILDCMRMVGPEVTGPLLAVVKGKKLIVKLLD